MICPFCSIKLSIFRRRCSDKNFGFRGAILYSCFGWQSHPETIEFCLVIHPRSWQTKESGGLEGVKTSNLRMLAFPLPNSGSDTGCVFTGTPSSRSPAFYIAGRGISCSTSFARKPKRTLSQKAGPDSFGSRFPHDTQYIVLTRAETTAYPARVAGALNERLIGNPVKIRGCPAAVSENERRNQALIAGSTHQEESDGREATASRNSARS